MIVNKKDFCTIAIELLFSGKIRKSLNSIVFKSPEIVYSTLSLKNKDISADRFELVNKDGSQSNLIKVDKFGDVFDIVVNGLLWKHKLNEAFINYAPYRTYQSEVGEYKIRQTGYGSMFYCNDFFVGRIRREENYIARYNKVFIDYLTKDAIDFLIAVCSVEILQDYFFKLRSVGE